MRTRQRRPWEVTNVPESHYSARRHDRSRHRHGARRGPRRRPAAFRGREHARRLPPRAKPLAVSSLCSYTSSQPSLVEGDTGTAVEQAQCELDWAYANGHGDSVAQDGQFGPLTEAATKAFQSCVGIAVDGEIGPITWSKLNYWVLQPGYACG
jgi:zinc D-Ala-D-Ala carboxypeptidase